MLEAVVVKKIKVSDARASLGLTQGQLAARARVASRVIYKAEHEQSVNRISAHAILNALNAVRDEQGKPSLEIENLDIKIQGGRERK